MGRTSAPGEDITSDAISTDAISTGALVWMLRETHAWFVLRLNAYLRSHGFDDLAPADGKNVLSNIDFDGTRIGDLARRAMITKQAMTQFVDRLERMNYVYRDVDENDKRSRVVFFTDRGRAAARVVDDAWPEIEREFEMRVGAEHAATLRSTLAIIAERLGFGPLGPEAAADI